MKPGPVPDHLRAQWHPDNPLQPETTKRKAVVLWRRKCREHQPVHVWPAEFGSRVRGAGCSVCRGLTVQAGVNDFATLAPPALVAEWADVNSIRPDEITLGARVEVLWTCAAGHSWLARVDSRTGTNRTGCKRCAGQAATAERNLVTLRPDVAALLHPSRNGDLDPTTLLPFSNVALWFRFACGHDRRAPVSSVSIGWRCTRCSVHTSREERTLLDMLAESFEDAAPMTVPVRWRGSGQLKPWNSSARVDIGFEHAGRSVAVEYDGSRYHRDRVSQDVSKTEALLAAGWTVVRVREQSHAATLDPLPIEHPDLHQILRPLTTGLDEVATQIVALLAE